MDVLEGFKACYITNHLADAEVKKMAELAKVETFNGGHVLVRQFDKNSDLMIVLEGKVRIFGFQNEEIAEGGPGAVLGEISLLDDKPRSATVTCSGTTKVAILKSEDFWKLLKADALLARIVLFNIGQVLCMRLRSANMQLDTVVREQHTRGWH